MTLRTAVVTLVFSLLATLAGSAQAGEWATYRAKKYGFSMLVPEGTSFGEKEWKNGWAGLVAKHDDLTLYGLGKLGEAETAEVIQKFGVKLTKMDAEHWKMIDEGKDNRGWKGYRTVKAEHDGHVVFGGYGTGPKGNYLILLKTTSDDFAKHKADYQKWYESVVLHADSSPAPSPAPAVPSPARPAGWSKYQAEKYGFSMLVPEGTKFIEKEWKNGWAGLVAKHDDLHLFALGKLGDAETAEAIQKFGVKVTKMDAEHWKMIDEGKDNRGWKGYRTVRAEYGGHVVFGGYGTGPKGNYLILLKTTSDDFAKHKADYQKWYESVVLQ